MFVQILTNVCNTEKFNFLTYCKNNGYILFKMYYFNGTKLYSCKTSKINYPFSLISHKYTENSNILKRVTLQQKSNCGVTVELLSQSLVWLLLNFCMNNFTVIIHLNHYSLSSFWQYTLNFNISIEMLLT